MVAWHTWTGNGCGNTGTAHVVLAAHRHRRLRGIDLPVLRNVGAAGAHYAHRVIVIRDRPLNEDRYLRFGHQTDRQRNTSIDTVAAVSVSSLPDSMPVGEQTNRDRGDANWRRQS